MEWQCETTHKLHENHVLEKLEIKGVQSVVYNLRFSNLIPQLQGVAIGVLLPKLQHDSFWAEGKDKFVTSEKGCHRGWTGETSGHDCGAHP